MATNLKQADLKIEVEGYISEKKLELTAEKGVEHIKGDIVIQTGDVNFTTFHIDQYSKKKDANRNFTNEDNKVFAGLKTIYEEYKSIANSGKEEADKIRTVGDITPYAYYKDGRYVEGVSYKSMFFNRVNPAEDDEMKAEFAVVGYISGIASEVDTEGQPTGRAKVSLWCPTYSGIERLVLIAPEEDGVAEAIMDDCEIGQTAEFFGSAVNSKVVTKREIPVKIGKPRVEVKTSYKNEFIITGMTEAYSEENAYDPEAIKQAVQERENRLNEQKAGNKSSSANGFGRKPAASGRTLPNF